MRLALALLTTALSILPALPSDSGRRDSYVFRDGEVTYMLGEGMSPESLKRLQARGGAAFLWAHRNGENFLSRDPGVLALARGVVQRNAARDLQEQQMARLVDNAMHMQKRAYVLYNAGTRSSVTAGTTAEELVALRSRFSGDFLWVRRGSEQWVIRDPQWLDRARVLFAPQMALAPEHVAIAREEADLDREEERIEERRDADSKARLADIHRRQEDVSRRERELDQREEELERDAEDKLWPLIDSAIRQGVAGRAR